eukprot:15433991-Alexandrium_andersonii.AAC.1
MRSDPLRSDDAPITQLGGAHYAVRRRPLRGEDPHPTKLETPHRQLARLSARSALQAHSAGFTLLLALPLRRGYCPPKAPRKAHPARGPSSPNGPPNSPLR